MSTCKPEVTIVQTPQSDAPWRRELARTAPLSPDARPAGGSGWTSFDGPASCATSEPQHLSPLVRGHVARSGTHLGHVLRHGPTGLRRRIEGAALTFAPEDG